MDSPIRYQIINALAERDLARQIWQSLQETAPHSFFNSWGWMSAWLASLPADREIKLLAAFLDGKPVAAFFAGRARGLRYGFLSSRTFALNATGNSHFDQLFIEYNRILLRPNFAPNWTELWHAIGPWDEFLLPGLAADFAQAASLSADLRGPFSVLTDKIENSHWVDLQKIRAANMDYLSLLSSNRRSQIRRSLREYEQEGGLTIREAGDLSEALTMYAGLIEMHQREWKKRGKPGAFTNDYFRQFHERLIRERFESGEIQLLQVNAGANPLGFLYCFLYQGNVLFYQSGFGYGEGNAQRPGLVSHYLAILHNASRGFNSYDFLAGEAQYKSSLATHSAPMLWMRLIRGPVRMRFEQSLLAARNKVKSMPGLLARLKSLRDRFDSQG
ncbi:MAG: GNAT family N-acetyltransferase [Chloroflexi bacterium]|nr:GNAT family N-acetyltransferase [Chloroflexota bacterium]